MYILADSNYSAGGKSDRQPRDERFPKFSKETADFLRSIGHTPPGGVLPHVSQIDWSTYDISEDEVWVKDAIHDRFKWLRENDPVHFTPNSLSGPYWSITRYEDVKAVDMDHVRFSNDAKFGGITLYDWDPDFAIPMFLAMDPPKHTGQRLAVQPSVAQDNLVNYTKLIRERTEFVLDGLPLDEPFNWVEKVSVELTTMMLATLFDFPFEDRQRLRRWSDVATGRFDREVCEGGFNQWMTEMLECLQYFNGVWTERSQWDKPGNDLISMMAHSEATKDMPPTEYLGNLILLIVGGNDTTRATMTNSVLGLNRFPREMEKLKADPSLVPSLVSEVLRWQAPLGYMRRTALEDVKLGGKVIRKGDKVAIWYVSANRDETVFEDPEVLKIDRENARKHLSFGIGIHRCLGSRLAELQLQILWEEILKRFDNIEVLEEPSRIPNPFIRGIRKMMVQVTPKKA